MGAGAILALKWANSNIFNGIFFQARSQGGEQGERSLPPIGFWPPQAAIFYSQKILRKTKKFKNVFCSSIKTIETNVIVLERWKILVK